MKLTSYWTRICGTVFSRKWICRYILVLFILSLIPMLYISRFNHPSVDDFAYGAPAYHAWQETGSLMETIEAAVEGTKNSYHTWQGTFTGIFLMRLQPAIFGEKFYPYVSIILILGFCAATMFLLKVILMDYLGIDKYSYGIISLVITFLSIQFVISPVSGFYWYNGSVYYTGFHTIALVLISLVLLSAKTNKRSKSIFYAVMVTILSFFIGGGNFVTAIASIVVLGMFFLYRLFRRGKWQIPLLGLLAMCIALFISAAAPGNAVRQADISGGLNPVLAILKSYVQGIDFVKVRIPMPVLWAFVCIVPLVYKVVKESRFTFGLPGLVTVLLYSIYASTFTPNLYVWDGYGPRRVLNVSYYVFLLFMLLTVIYWSGWFAKKLPFLSSNHPKWAKSGENVLAGKGAVLKVVVICVGMICFILTGRFFSDTNATTGISATMSVLTGEAEIYHYQYKERLALYENPEIKDVVVPAYTVAPHVLVYDDITPDSTDWRNSTIAIYYNKNSVILKTQ